MPVHDNERTSVRLFSTKAFQRVEHGLNVALAALLCATSLLALAGAAVTLWSGLGDWPGTNSVFVVSDRLLVVLIEQSLCNSDFRRNIHEANMTPLQCWTGGSIKLQAPQFAGRSAAERPSAM
jgi:hypothetical protein